MLRALKIVVPMCLLCLLSVRSFATTCVDGGTMPANPIVQGSINAGKSLQAVTAIAGVSGCQIVVYALTGDLVGSTTAYLGFLVVEVASSANCTLAYMQTVPLAMWARNLSIEGTYTTADHVTLSPTNAPNNGGVMTATGGDAVCIGFTGADTNNWETFSYYAQYR